MFNLIEQARQSISQRVLDLCQTHFGAGVEVSQFKFETPPDDALGHLAFACFPLAKAAKTAPPKIAALLAEHWGDLGLFDRVVPSGPYLNFFFGKQALWQELLPQVLQDPQYGFGTEGQGQTLLLEYSSPNTNKPLHLGHGRNNLLGMVIANLLEATGYKVVRANLVNDRGIHICKSMLAYQKWGQGQTPENTGKKGDKLVGDFYVLYAQKVKEHPELEEEAAQMLRDWEAGQPEVLELWKQMNSWVLSGFAQTYERMGCRFDRYYYESQTYLGGRELILQMQAQGKCQTEDNGAVSIDLEAEGLGKKILLRGDGTSMYITQDINTTITKFKDYPLDGCLFVVGNEQDNHFRILFKVLEKFGFDWAHKLEHVSYGMITLPEGKMKSREGTVVDLDQLLDELRDLALEGIAERHPDAAEAEKQDFLFRAEAIGQAALSFYILRSGAAKEIQFNPKESLAFEGQTGPYLQYTHARICSLLGRSGQESAQSKLPELLNPEEEGLLLLLARFPEALRLAARERNPAVLCNALYQLCKLFNKFYYDHPILKATEEDKQTRLTLCWAVRSVLARGLTLLGIQPLERM